MTGNSRFGQLRWWWLVAAALVVLGVIMVAAVTAPHAGDAATTTPSASATTAMRTVVVSTKADALSDGVSGQLKATLVEGIVPLHDSMGTVLTDADCAPDAAGISHCLNTVRLADGSVLAVRHHHPMARVPCLSPGEKVIVSAAA